MTSAIEFVGVNRYLRTSSQARVQSRLESELERIKKRMEMGYEVRVKWVPGAIRSREGNRLAEEVRGDIIFIYVEKEKEALGLLRHGFVEWILNQYSAPYMQLINKLIMLFEEQQYKRKEKTVEALAKLLR